MSQIDTLIEPEIRNDALYDLIKHLAASEPLSSVLEIGSSAGGGSTEAFVAGLKDNKGSPKLFCVEVSKARFEKLRATYAAYPFVHCYNRSSVAVDEFPKPDVLRAFYAQIDSGLRKFPLEQVLGWLDQDIAYVRDAGVAAGAIEAIKVEHNIDIFDMVLIDGSEFTGKIEFEKVRGARLILLDDTNTFKCWHVRQKLLADPMYDVIADDQKLRNGYAAFRRRKLARRLTGELPIHFLTIVLNGEPFIRYHEQMLAGLDISWHWHIVEGVAELRHDTAWSLTTGGRIPSELHDQGRSNDGTSVYLDDLARRFRDKVTVYRKPLGAFWDGKLEMVNAPIPNIAEECLLWQIDNDELWTAAQVMAVHRAFTAEPERTAASYWCWYYVGPDKIISTRYNYAQNPEQEWLRTWRYRPGARWAAHEPPALVEPDPDNASKTIDVGKRHPFSNDEMEAIGAVFQHYAYATEDQLIFKEIYYGYRGARQQWRALQTTTGSGELKDFFGWVTDNTVFDTSALYLIDPIARLDTARTTWTFDSNARLAPTARAHALKSPRIAVDGIYWQHLSSGIGRVWNNVLREWVKSGFAEQVIVLDRAGTAPRIPGVHYWTIPRHSYQQTGLDSLNLDTVCQRLGVDLFASTYYSCTAAVPSFFVGHDMIPEMLGFPLDDETWREKHRAILHAAGHSMVSACSAADLERLYPELPRRGTHVAHNGVAPEFGPVCAEEVVAFRAKYGLTGKRYVLWIGERHGYGGYKNGALAFKALSTMTNAPTLVCIGGHAEIEADLRQLAPRVDVLRLALDDVDLRSAYAGALALIYPSKYEGFGMPPLESMACGTPAIVCRNSALPEVVGDAALFIRENEPADLVLALRQLEDHKVRVEMVSRGQLQAAKFTFGNTARTLAEALVETHRRISIETRHRGGAGWQEMRRLLAAQQNRPFTFPVALPSISNGSTEVVLPATGSATGPAGSSAAFLRKHAEIERELEELRSIRNSPFWKARDLSVALLKRMKIRNRA